MRVRGLKFAFFSLLGKDSVSHPMRVRGLKLIRNGTEITIPRRTPCGCVD